VEEKTPLGLPDENTPFGLLDRQGMELAAHPWRYFDQLGKWSKQQRIKPFLVN
jgi:hypothetical protein